MFYWGNPKNNFLDVVYRNVFCDTNSLTCPTDAPQNAGCGDWPMFCGSRASKFFRVFMVLFVFVFVFPLRSGVLSPCFRFAIKLQQHRQSATRRRAAAASSRTTATTWHGLRLHSSASRSGWPLPVFSTTSAGTMPSKRRRWWCWHLLVTSLLDLPCSGFACRIKVNNGRLINTTTILRTTFKS